MRKILIVEDDHGVAVAIQKFLRHKHCDSVIAESGLQGLAAVEQSSFDLAVIDLGMLGMDESETLGAFRKRAPTLPIVVMTGYVFSHTRGPPPDFAGMAAMLGANYCLPKPIRARHLLDAIEGCLTRRANDATGAASQAAARRSGPDTPRRTTSENG